MLKGCKGMRMTKMGEESQGINMYEHSGGEDKILKIVVSMMEMEKMQSRAWRFGSVKIVEEGLGDGGRRGIQRWLILGEDASVEVGDVLGIWERIRLGEGLAVGGGGYKESREIVRYQMGCSRWDWLW